jgi:hypothetical protein
MALDRMTRRTRYTSPPAQPVRWQSGDAADCKSANVGSIPARTSTTGFQAAKILRKSQLHLVFHEFRRPGISSAIGLFPLVSVG